MDLIAPAVAAIAFFVCFFALIGGMLNMRQEQNRLMLKKTADWAGDSSGGAYAAPERCKQRAACRKSRAAYEARRQAGAISRLNDGVLAHS